MTTSSNSNSTTSTTIAITTAKRREHAQSIVHQLSLDQKLSLISGKSLWSLSNVLKDLNLDFPGSIWLSDGPHGLRKTIHDKEAVQSVQATCWPCSTALACSWNLRLLETIVGHDLGKEAAHHGVSVVLGPAMNLQRHPCGGRSFEYFSEDPLVTGKCAASIAAGIQSISGVGACLKHLCVNNQEHRRYVIDTKVDERTLRELYLRGFEYAIQHSRPWTLMCAYNKLNGVFCSEQEWLFQDIVRKEWGFDGVVLTDWGATNDRVAGLKAGVDLEMPGSYGVHNVYMIEALARGQLPQECLDQAVTRIVELFLKAHVENENDTNVPTRSTALLDLEAHHQDAHRMALECPVLLKNDDSILPLSPNASVAVIGAFAKTPRYQGMGSSQVNPYKVSCLWDVITSYTTNVSYTQGFELEDAGDEISHHLIAQAVDAAKSASGGVVLLMVGLPEISESEAFDRPHINLPAHHNALIEAVCAVHPNTVVVLSNGGPVTMPWVNQPKAIVEAFLLGQAGGHALADLLFGKVSFSGKLAQTFARHLDDLPANTNFPGNDSQVEYREGLNVGYRYFGSAAKAPPVLYCFGHGLSYTTFDYSNLQVTVDKDQEDEKQVSVQFQITNTGSFEAAEIAQLYVHVHDSAVYRPALELREFVKISLTPGETSPVLTLVLSANAFSFWDVGYSEWVVEPGRYVIQIGASCQDIRKTATIHFATGRIASQNAQKTHPPTRITHPLVVDNVTFSQMMDRESSNDPMIPSDDDDKQQKLRIIHRNTLITDAAKSTWIGYILGWIIFLISCWYLPDKRDRKMLRVAHAMCYNLPLRGIVLFGEGRLSFVFLDILIAFMNGHYCKALLLQLQSVELVLWNARPRSSRYQEVSA
jgi:beta-glucosidase